MHVAAKERWGADLGEDVHLSHEFALDGLRHVFWHAG